MQKPERFRFLGGTVQEEDCVSGHQPVPLIDPSRCDGCGRCVAICPSGALTMHDGRAAVSRPVACDYHGWCEKVCPTQAIRRPFEIVTVD